MEELNKEIQKISDEAQSMAEKSMASLLRAYKRSLDEVRNQIAQIYMTYAKDGQLELGRQQRYAVLTQLEKHLTEQAKALGEKEVQGTTSLLESVFSESFYRTSYVLEAGLEFEANLSILRPEFVQAASEIPIEGKMFSDRIWKNKEALVNRLREEIERGMVQGDSIDKMARRIKNTFGSSAYESKRLSQTETARCMTQAQEEVYKASGLVKKVMFDATLDDKTSDQCQRQDGKVFDMSGVYPKPPLHPNCRSCLIPVVDGWSPQKKRENIKADEGKPIIDYTNYETWKESRTNQ